MKRFDPEARVDQEQEYRTSHHGRALLAGDQKVATCIDCHGVHGIVKADNPASPVYPSRVAETCHSCHGDPERMAGYTTAAGRPLPTDQFDHWRYSVHGNAMLVKGDLSAPTCNDCHGNHGATPPGLDSITFVCGQCHGRETDLFRASRKHELLVDHNDYLADAGLDGCAACHEAPEPAAQLTTVTAFTDCTTCHGNHGVIRPTVAMLSPLPGTPCAFCHEGPGPLSAEIPEPVKTRENYESTLASLLQQGETEGWEGDVLFDRLVDAALALPYHTAASGAVGEDGTPLLRPEFQHLFEKFRIGKIRNSFEGEGGVLEVEVARCGSCHAEEPLLADGPVGFEMARQMVGQMHELTAVTARAERILLTARRGGVETREALEHIEAAVKAQIELEVLVHSFATGEGSAFQEKQQEGLESARAALVSGQDALGELTFRRQGLMVALALIVLVLIALAFKIRELSLREEVQS
jgi:cytochrome c553